MDESFEAFVAARGAALWRSAWLLTGDHGIAEDLVQTALAKAWPHYDRVRATGSFEAYVRRVLFTTYATWWRRKWRGGERPSADVPELTGDADEARQAGARRDVQLALAALSPKQRAVGRTHTFLPGQNDERQAAWLSRSDH